MIDILSCPKGAEGKSTFQKRLVYKNPTKVLFIPVSDTVTQVLSAFVNFVESNGYVGPELVLIDIPRALDYGSKDPVNIIKLHNIAELLRTGMVCTTMYGKYKSVLVKPPRILICTNYDYEADDKSHLWAPANRYAIHVLSRLGERVVIPGLRHLDP